MIFLYFLLLINFAFLVTTQVLNISSNQCFLLAIGLLVSSKAHKHRWLALQDKLICLFIWQILNLCSHFFLPFLLQHWSVFKLCHSHHISFLVCPPQSARGRFQVMVSLSMNSCALPFRVILLSLVILLYLIFLVS